MSYALGAVKPWVQSAAEEIGNRYSIGTIYGIGQREGPSDHPKGLATDFMVYADEAKGDAVAAYITANWSRLGISYIIWKQRIKSSALGPWVPMEDRGSITANHFDHVHTSYQSTAPTGGGPIVDVLSDVAGATGTGSADTSGGGVGGLTSWLSSSTNWIRVFSIILGGILVIMALVLFVKQRTLGAVISKVTSNGN